MQRQALRDVVASLAVQWLGFRGFGGGNIFAELPRGGGASFLGLGEGLGYRSVLDRVLLPRV